MTALSGLGRLSVLNAMTQPTGLYRALVRLFLSGSEPFARRCGFVEGRTRYRQYAENPVPTSSISQQLQQVAQLIQVRGALGMSRQIFFCSLGGFDTHTQELPTQQQLFAELAPALDAFYKATVEKTVADQVTTFTESDFARTLSPNSNGGTDHAWGGHHLVMGASVKGGQLYGKFPTLLPSGPDDAGTEGRWIPTTAVDQYAATLAQWFGLPTGQLATVFPNLANFGSTDLGFFG